MDKNELVKMVLELASAEPIAIDSGTELFREGEAGDQMFVIVKGEIRLSINNETLGTEMDGGIVGEMALIDGSARSATATAMTDCVLVPLNEAAFTALVGTHPAFAVHVMRVLSNRLRLANEILKFF